jgi:hypothetical protein
MSLGECAVIDLNSFRFACPKFPRGSELPMLLPEVVAAVPTAGRIDLGSPFGHSSENISTVIKCPPLAWRQQPDTLIGHGPKHRCRGSV